MMREKRKTGRARAIIRKKGKTIERDEKGKTGRITTLEVHNQNKGSR